MNCVCVIYSKSKDQRFYRLIYKISGLLISTVKSVVEYYSLIKNNNYDDLYVFVLPIDYQIDDAINSISDMNTGRILSKIKNKSNEDYDLEIQNLEMLNDITNTTKFDNLISSYKNIINNSYSENKPNYDYKNMITCISSFSKVIKEINDKPNSVLEYISKLNNLDFSDVKQFILDKFGLNIIEFKNLIIKYDIDPSKIISLIEKFNIDGNIEIKKKILYKTIEKII